MTNIDQIFESLMMALETSVEEAGTGSAKAYLIANRLFVLTRGQFKRTDQVTRLNQLQAKFKGTETYALADQPTPQMSQTRMPQKSSPSDEIKFSPSDFQRGAGVAQTPSPSDAVEATGINPYKNLIEQSDDKLRKHFGSVVVLSKTNQLLASEIGKELGESKEWGQALIDFRMLVTEKLTAKKTDQTNIADDKDRSAEQSGESVDGGGDARLTQGSDVETDVQVRDQLSRVQGDEGGNTRGGDGARSPKPREETNQ